MDPITGALLAGAAAAAANETAKAVVKDAYEGLKAKVKQWFAERKRPEGEMALTMIEEEPETWQAALAASLKKSGAVDNEELLQAAQALLKIVEEAKAQAGCHAAQSGSGAIAQNGGTAAGAGGVAVGGNVQGSVYTHSGGREMNIAQGNGAISKQINTYMPGDKRRRNEQEE